MKIVKTILLYLFFFPVCVFAASQESKGEWFFNEGLVLLPPLEGFEKNIFLFSGQDNNVILWSVPDDGGNGYCKPGETTDFVDINPIKINEQYYKFTYMCLNGNTLLVPKTNEGKSYLTNTVMSKKTVAVSLGDGLTLHYPPSNIEGMLAKKKIMSQAR